jgi:hypothetical protein
MSPSLCILPKVLVDPDHLCEVCPLISTVAKTAIAIVKSNFFMKYFLKVRYF